MVSNGWPSSTPNVDATLDDNTYIMKNWKFCFFDIIGFEGTTVEFYYIFCSFNIYS